MTVTAETEAPRDIPKEVSSQLPPPRRSRHSSSSRRYKKDERESKTEQHRSRQPRRRDRIAPDAPSGRSRMTTSRVDSSSNNNGSDVRNQSSGRRRSSKGSSSKSPLKVSTDPDGEYDSSTTPKTEPSTPEGTVVTAATPPGVRGRSDLRSPGQRKTPTLAPGAKVASDNEVPDFITQTDRYGNASTPRSDKAIDEARKIHPSGVKPHLHVDREGKLTEEEEEELSAVDACAETLYDSLRLVCCCLVPEDAVKPCTGRASPQAVKEEADDNKMRLLPALHPEDNGKKCLVLDLDETLVHSSFRAVPGADFVIPVQIEDVVHFVYVAKRPGVDEFLIEMAKHYEVVVYTASLNKYADPLLDLLDPQRVIRTRLFRESCVYYEGNYVKDLSLLDRDLSHTIIIDNSPSSYVFHPENAIDCTSFIDDPKDRELDQIADFLIGIKDSKDVRGVAPRWREWPDVEVDDQ